MYSHYNLLNFYTQSLKQHQYLFYRGVKNTVYKYNMKPNSFPKASLNQYFSQQFHQKIDTMVMQLTSQDEKEDIQQYLDTNFQLPDPQTSQPIPPHQIHSNNLFEEYMQMYLENKTEQENPIFGFFQIVQNIANEYKKSITPERLQQINLQLYDLTKQKEIVRSKGWSTSGSDNSKSTSYIMDYYLYEIKQHKQKIEDLQEQLSHKSEEIKQLQFKLFSLQSRFKREIKNQHVLLNPICPQVLLNSQLHNETEIKDLDLQTIKQDLEEIEADQLDSYSKEYFSHDKNNYNTEQIPQNSLELQQNYPINNHNLPFINIQQNDQSQQPQIRSQSKYVSDPQTITAKVKDTNFSMDFENKYNFQCLIHSLELQNLKLQQSLSNQQKQNLLQKQEILILKKQKDYYFKELKIKQTELKKCNKIVYKLLSTDQKCQKK